MKELGLKQNPKINDLFHKTKSSENVPKSLKERNSQC